MSATMTMANSMKTTSGIMAKMNLQMNPRDIELTAQQMMRQKEQASMVSEIMDDMFDCMDEDGIEEEMEQETMWSGLKPRRDGGIVVWERGTRGVWVSFFVWGGGSFVNERSGGRE